MIYITYRNSMFDDGISVDSVYDVNFDNVEELYLNFLAEKAKEMKIVHNNHWGNIMNRENHHPHLTEKEYKEKVKSWNKFLRQYNIKKFITDNLKGRKLEFKQIVKWVK